MVFIYEKHIPLSSGVRWEKGPAPGCTHVHGWSSSCL